MTLPASIRISADVMSRQVADETVVLDLASGNYYGLDPVGTRIWQLLTEGLTPTQVRDALLGEYDVSAAQLEADMERLFIALGEQGLLTAP